MFPEVNKLIVTQQFADEGLSLERLEVVDVFSSSDEDDGTPGGCDAGGKQQKSVNKQTKRTHGAVQRRRWSYALRAPPPLACPSSFVMITDATSTLSLKALA